MPNSKFYENDIIRELDNQRKKIQDVTCPSYIRELNNQFKKIQNNTNIFPAISELSHLQKCIQETNLYFDKLRMPIQNSVYYKTKLDITTSYLRNISHISSALNQLANISFQIFQSDFNSLDINDLKSKIHSYNEALNNEVESEDSDPINMSINDIEKIEDNYKQIVYIVENMNVYLSTDNKIEVPKKSNTIFKKLILILNIIGYFNTVIAFQTNMDKATEIVVSQVKQSINESSTSSSSIEIADPIKYTNKDK